MGGYGPVENGCCTPSIDVDGLGCKGVHCCLFVSLLAGPVMNCLFLLWHGLVSSC